MLADGTLTATAGGAESGAAGAVVGRGVSTTAAAFAAPAAGTTGVGAGAVT
jgi:hypothetical protein